MKRAWKQHESAETRPHDTSPAIHRGENIPAAEVCRPGRDHPVEDTHVDVVEELGEELDGEGRVHPTPAQKGHRAAQDIQNLGTGRDGLELRRKLLRVIG